MPNITDPAKGLAKFLARSKAKERLYHGTPEDVTAFREGRPTFLSPNPKFAEDFAYMRSLPGGKKQVVRTPGVVMPLHASVENPFDPDVPEHVEALAKRLSADPDLAELARQMSPTPGYVRSTWSSAEHPEVQRAIQDLGHDAFYLYEGGQKNLGVYDPRRIKSATGNRGTYDITDPDITKAEGGPVNPIKTPNQMLLEMAGIPHLAGGGNKFAMFGQFANQVKNAVEAFINEMGRAPTQKEMQGLKSHIESISRQPTGALRTGPAAAPRAQYELATDPNLISPNTAPDPFLMKSMTGRTAKGSAYMTPEPMDVADPNVIARIEQNQVEGIMGKEVPSTTPSADYIADMSRAAENQALSAGKVPLIDRLKLEFYKKNNRFPNEEELDAIVAAYNPLRHQYGEMGASIVGERPRTARGMEDWRNRARAEGIEEAYLNKPPADYPQYLKDEMQILQGKTPTVKQRTPRERKGSEPTPGSTIRRYDEEGNEVETLNFRTGGSSSLTADEMRHEMMARGRTPSKFGTTMQNILQSSPVRAISGQGANKAFGALGALGSGMAALESADEGDILGTALHGTSAAANAAMMVPKYAAKAIPAAGAVAVPLSVKEAYERYQMGDRTGAVISALKAGLGAAQVVPHPLVIYPAMGASIALDIYDAMRDQPERKSIMEQVDLETRQGKYR